MSNDELIYYAFITLGFSIKEAREMVANHKEQIKQELALHFALREAKWRQTVRPETIKAIEAILSKGYRVELIPVKDGVKVIQVQRKEIK